MKLTLKIIMLLAFLNQVQAQQTFTLDEAVDYGLNSSVQLKMDAIDLKTANLEIKEFRGLGLPNISGSINYNYFIDIPVNLVPAEFFGGQPGTFAALKFGTDHRLTAGVTLNQLIFDGSFFTGLKVQEVYRELIARKVDQTEYDLRGNITKAYMNVLLIDENLEVLVKNMSNIEQTKNETEKILDAGFAEALDVQRLNLTLDILLAESENLKRIREINLMMLKYQMNYSLDQEIVLTQTLDDFVDKILTVDIPMDEETDYAKRPEYNQIEIGEQLNALKLKAKRNDMLPKLYGFAQHEQVLQRNKLFEEDEPGFTKNTIVGAKLDIPIFEGLRKNLAVQKTKLEIEKTTLQKEEFKRGMDLQIQSAYEMFLNARNKVMIAKRQESLANDIYDITDIKYKQGVGSSMERTQAERDLFEAQSAYMQALFDMVMAKIELDVAKGELRERNY